MFDLAHLLPGHFDKLIGLPLPLAGSDFCFTVKSVDRLRSPSPRGEPFTLTLEAPPDTRGGQGIYHLQHPDLGVLAIFLVPIAVVDGRSQFEAVFN